MTNVETFFKHTYENNALQEQLTKALKDMDGEEVIRAVCDIAKSYGCPLSMEEAAVAVKALGQEESQDAELSDTELEAVAGGKLGRGRYTGSRL